MLLTPPFSHTLQSTHFTDVTPTTQLAYKFNTPLLQQIRHLRQATGQAWVTVDGFEFIPEQGIAQFELMTGRKAPRNRMRAEVLQNYQVVVDQEAKIDIGVSGGAGFGVIDAAL